MKKTLLKNAGLTTLALAASTVSANAQNATRVEINGAPLQTQVAPIQMNNRTLVPMRAIFNGLGAQVNYNRQTRGISAQRGNTRVMLNIGSRYATVNGRNVTLDQAPMVRSQRTLVPLRFVSEALGAQVGWNENQRLVTIRDNNVLANNPNRPNNNSGSQVGGFNTISVPRGAVVKVQLEQQISSATAQRGDTFAARVVSQNDGDAEFPRGTRLEGVITEATPRTNQNPGVLDLDFRTVVLPDGTRRPMRASLISLDNDSVDSMENGRIMAKSSSGGTNAKSVIVGGAAGYLLGRLLKRNSVITSVLGAGGGYLYDRNKNKDRTRDAVLPAGEQFGVRLDSAVTYNDINGYSNRRRGYLGS